MPAARLFWLLGLGAVAMAGGLAVPSLIRLGVVVDLVAVVAFGVDWVRARRIELTAKRRWPPTLVQAAEVEIEVEIENPSGRPVETRLAEGLGPALARAPERRDLVLPPRSISSWRYGMRPRRRGAHAVDALRARVLGPWRLAWSQQVLIAGETRHVYPQISWGGQVGALLGLARRRQLGLTPMHLEGAGTEPYGLREYIPGDPLSKVHWKATARHRRLISREETWERGVSLVILLDASRAMSGAVDERNKLDHGLAAALALSRLAVGRGDRVTFLAFSDQVERTVRVRSSTRGISAAYAALFDLDTRLVEPAYDRAAEAAYALGQRGAVVVLLTSVVDLAAAEVLREATLRLRQRYRTLLVNLEDPSVQCLAEAAPADPEEAFAQVSSLGLLRMNRDLGRRLRRAGVRTVSCPADRLALETLTAYLAVFGRATARSRSAAVAVGAGCPPLRSGRETPGEGRPPR